MNQSEFAAACLQIAFKRPVITPGGRAGNNATHGSRANGTNWVERTATGKLPEYIRIVRNGLMKQGHTEGSATALAVGAMKRWARGGDNVSPPVQAAAAKALAEWEAMKAEKSGESSMEIEYKAVAVKGLKAVESEPGVVETFVSVTGLKDNVKDIIEPGAYQKTLIARTPKGVWSHDWDTPIAKALDAKELLPGDPMLPATLANGEPWPADAGALYIKAEFNLGTTKGADAYSNVIFFGDQQEWSIGYHVPEGGATMDRKAQARRIQTLDLYEFSPVLFGAMPNARTATVKSAQETNLAFKSLLGEDYRANFDLPALEKFIIESKAYTGEEEDVDLLPDDEITLEPDVAENKGMLSAANVGLMKKAIDALTELLDSVTSDDPTATDGAAQEEKTLDLPDDIEGKSLSDIYSAAEGVLGSNKAELKHLAETFDGAIEQKDDEAIEEAATAFLDVIDDSIDDAEDLEHDGLKALAGAIHSILVKALGDADEEDTNDVEDTTGGSDVDERDGSNTEEKREVPETELKDLRDFLNQFKA